jgi:hypothetical protein
MPMGKKKRESPFKGLWQIVSMSVELHGMIFFHEGDESGFVAESAKGKKGKKGK